MEDITTEWIPNPYLTVRLRIGESRDLEGEFVGRLLFPVRSSKGVYWVLQLENSSVWYLVRPRHPDQCIEAVETEEVIVNIARHSDPTADSPTPNSHLDPSTVDFFAIGSISRLTK